MSSKTGTKTGGGPGWNSGWNNAPAREDSPSPRDWSKLSDDDSDSLAGQNRKSNNGKRSVTPDKGSGGGWERPGTAGSSKRDTTSKTTSKTSGTRSGWGSRDRSPSPVRTASGKGWERPSTSSSSKRDASSKAGTRDSRQRSPSPDRTASGKGWERPGTAGSSKRDASPSKSGGARSGWGSRDRSPSPVRTASGKGWERPGTAGSSNKRDTSSKASRASRDRSVSPERTASGKGWERPGTAGSSNKRDTSSKAGASPNGWGSRDRSPSPDRTASGKGWERPGTSGSSKRDTSSKSGWGSRDRSPSPVRTASGRGWERPGTSGSSKRDTSSKSGWGSRDRSPSPVRTASGKGWERPGTAGSSNKRETSSKTSGTRSGWGSRDRTPSPERTGSGKGWERPKQSKSPEIPTRAGRSRDLSHRPTSSSNRMGSSTRSTGSNDAISLLEGSGKSTTRNGSTRKGGESPDLKRNQDAKNWSRSSASSSKDDNASKRPARNQGDTTSQSRSNVRSSKGRNTTSSTGRTVSGSPSTGSPSRNKKKAESDRNATSGTGSPSRVRKTASGSRGSLKATAAADPEPIDAKDRLTHFGLHVLQFLRRCVVVEHELIPAAMARGDYDTLSDILKELGDKYSFHTEALDALHELPSEDLASFAQIKSKVQEYYLKCVRAVSTSLKTELSHIGLPGPAQWPSERIAALFRGVSKFDSYLSVFSGILGGEQRRRKHDHDDNKSSMTPQKKGKGGHTSEGVHDDHHALMKEASALATNFVSAARDCMLGRTDVLVHAAVGRARLAVANGDMKKVASSDGADLAKTLDQVYDTEKQWFTRNWSWFNVSGQSRQIEYVEDIYLELQQHGVNLQGTSQAQCETFFLDVLLLALAKNLQAVDTFDLIRRIREYNPLSLSSVSERDPTKFLPFLSPLRPVFIVRRDMWLSRNLALIDLELSRETFNRNQLPESKSTARLSSTRLSDAENSASNTALTDANPDLAMTKDDLSRLSVGKTDNVSNVTPGTQAVLLALASLRYAIQCPDPHRDLIHAAAGPVLSLALSKYSMWIEQFPADDRSLSQAVVLHNDLLHISELVAELLHPPASTPAPATPSANSGSPSSHTTAVASPAEPPALFRITTKRYHQSLMMMQARLVELSGAKTENAVIDACRAQGIKPKVFFGDNDLGPSPALSHILANVMRPVSKTLMSAHRRTRTSMLPRLYAVVVNGYLDYIRDSKMKLRLAQAQALRRDHDALEKFIMNTNFVLAIDTDLLLGSTAHRRFKSVVGLVEGSQHTGAPLADQAQWQALKK